jgi:hypothetical protein
MEDHRPTLLLPRATLAYGGMGIAFHSPDPELRFAVREPHTNFLAEAGVPTLDVTCHVGDPSPGGGERIFDSGGTWELRREGADGEEATFYTATADGGREPMIRLTMDGGLTRATVVHAPTPEGAAIVPVGFPLDEYLASRMLARAGRVVLHACALARDGEALVFMGHSGAGKSTMAALGEGAGARVLSDDRTILAPSASGIEAWGTPWHGSYTRGLSESAPVAGIFLLAHGTSDELHRLEPGRAFGEICVRLVQPTVHRGELEAGLGAAERIVATVPIWELRFRPTTAAYALAREAAAAASANRS